MTDADAWAATHALPAIEGRRRVYQHAAVCCVAEDPWLRERLALRGSMPLWLVHGHVRGSRDVDLSILPPSSAPESTRHTPEEIEDVRRQVVAALSTGMPRRIPDLPRWTEEIMREMRVEVRPASGPVATRERPLYAPGLTLRMYELEVLILEKLYAIAKQPGRRNRRGKDVFDIYHLMQSGRVNVNELREAAAVNTQDARFPPPGMSAARNLKAMTQPTFIAACERFSDEPARFDEAWNVVTELARTAGLISSGV